MKSFKTIISIVFLVGTVAIIVYDSQTRVPKSVKGKTASADSAARVPNKK